MTALLARLRRLSGDNPVQWVKVTPDDWSELEPMIDSAHYANGVADLAMKHRDIAESRIENAVKADAAATFCALGLPHRPEWNGRTVAIVLLEEPIFDAARNATNEG